MGVQRKKCIYDFTLFFDKAEAILDAKQQIILRMDQLEPGRGWLLDGAQFLKTRRGQHFSLNSLNAILNSK